MPDLYKGNMQDFVDKVSQYMREKFGKTVSLARLNGPRRRTPSRNGEPARSIEGNMDYYVCIQVSPSTSYTGLVYDREDFEQQVYDIINKILDISPSRDSARERVENELRSMLNTPPSIVGDWGPND